MIERICSEIVLFLFVFLFKLFIQDVDEISFLFVFATFLQLCPEKCAVPYSLEGKRIASLVRRPNSPLGRVAQAGYFFLFQSSSARCSSE